MRKMPLDGEEAAPYTKKTAFRETTRKAFFLKRLL